MKDNLPIKKNIRLEQYDYSQIGYYFITICVKNRENILSKIDKGNNNCTCILTNTISKIIQQLKGKITKEFGYSVWQKLFYEHIIRNEKEYLEIKNYIQNNPYNWEKDTYY